MAIISITLILISVGLIYLTTPAQKWISKPLPILPNGTFGVLCFLIAIILWQFSIGWIPALFAGIVTWIFWGVVIPGLTYPYTSWKKGRS